MFLVLDEEDVYCGEVLTLPQGQCAVVRFRGSHENAAAHYAALLEYLRENQLELAGFSREMTLIDNCISNDPDTYVTEIRIPVRAAEQPVRTGA